MRVRIRLLGTAQHSIDTDLLRVEDTAIGKVAVVANQFANSGESRYRVSDGRSLDDNDRPTAWNFWELSAESRRRITEGDEG